MRTVWLLPFLGPVFACARAQQSDPVTSASTVSGAAAPPSASSSAAKARADPAKRKGTGTAFVRRRDGFPIIEVRADGTIRPAPAATSGKTREGPFRGLDGRVYFVSPFNVERIAKDGGAEVFAPLPAGKDGLNDILVRPDGTAYARVGANLWHWDGRTWDWSEEIESRTRADGVQGVVVGDAEGSTWMAHSASQLVVRSKAGGSWPALEAVGKVDRVAAAPDGTLYVGGDGKGVLRTKSSRGPFERLSFAAIGSVDRLVVSSGGKSVAAQGVEAIHVLFEARERRFDRDALAIDFVQALDVDDLGRVWLTTGDELFVLGPEGADVVRIPLAGVELLRGGIDRLVVLGEGPTPPVAGPVPRVDVTARLVARDGKPLANTSVEICPGIGTSRCETTKYPATTDADGKLRVTALPLGEYVVARQLGGKRARFGWLTGLSKAHAAARGAEIDLGKVVETPESAP